MGCIKMLRKALIWCKNALYKLQAWVKWVLPLPPEASLPSLSPCVLPVPALAARKTKTPLHGLQGTSALRRVGAPCSEGYGIVKGLVPSTTAPSGSALLPCSHQGAGRTSWTAVIIQWARHVGIWRQCFLKRNYFCGGKASVITQQDFSEEKC